MIGYLYGKPLISGKMCYLLVQGVGYQVEVSTTTLEAMTLKHEVELFIHTHVREDALELYGFLSSDEKNLFEVLLKVSGVGPRSALALTGLGTNQIVQAVQQADTTLLTQVPRIGKKLAQKIIIDLKSKLGSFQELDLQSPSQARSELSQALIQLGFNEIQISKAIKDIDVDHLSLEQSIKLTLQQLGKQS